MIGVSSSSFCWIPPASCCCGLQVDGRDVVRDHLVVVRVLVVRRVPGAVGEQRRRQEHVRHAAVAVVDEAHDRVEPVRLAEHGVAVVRAAVLDRELDRDADLLRGVDDDLRVLRDLLRLDRDQLGLEPVRHAGVGRGAPWPCRRPAPAAATDVSVCANTGANGESLPRSDLPWKRPSTIALAVDRQGDRLAHAGVVERLLVGPHRQLAVGGRLQRDDLVRRVVEDRLGARDRHLLDDVELVALQRQDLRGLVGREGDLELVRDAPSCPSSRRCGRTTPTRPPGSESSFHGPVPGNVFVKSPA